jgi:hypothetical protein
LNFLHTHGKIGSMAAARMAAVIFAAASAASSVAAWAQQPWPGHLNIAVVDTSGAAVLCSYVTVTSTDTGLTLYVLPMKNLDTVQVALESGSYRISASAFGFSKWSAPVDIAKEWSLRSIEARLSPGELAGAMPCSDGSLPADLPAGWSQVSDTVPLEALQPLPLRPVRAHRHISRPPQTPSS